ncbi:ribosomal-protein-alanine N-acetyltransferase [Paenibacillus uliginis N3/975]|uniref:Ribosomal-protein-alanine N-acetyltransferase n=1 Tax=Paenibacillus uliginis N3/975 TaxID=1313296 RepID=A0A1X7HI36_9BACL|nr:GNAT family protein [Paenibacillus uliginis]SMF87098.1 ribosomal-protein-alanine N-acetyltransferase [Paenibacillus uliginis N3/975]
MLIKCFIPFPILETERLILRLVEDRDAEQLYEILSDAEVAKFDYFYPVTSKEQVLKFIERYKKEIEENEEITWGIILKETNKLIGTCCLGSFDEGARRGELGYDIAQVKWGKGYATEALEAVIDYGFDIMNLNRIEATITPGNDASVKVLSKLNFIQEGVVRERDLIKGKLEDGIMMSILKRDYIKKSRE